MVFVEVKSRSSKEYGLPAESVTKKKIKHIYKTAEYYLDIKNLKEIFTRIDVIEVYEEKTILRINHIKQIV